MGKPIVNDVDYFNHETVTVDGDKVHIVEVHVNGSPLPGDSGAVHAESIICRVFVQEADCPSESRDDLRRHAVRRLKTLSDLANRGISA